MSEWQSDFCSFFETWDDCLLGYFFPCVHAFVASDAAGQEPIWGILQCFFYPLLVPVLRNQVREEKNIDGTLVEDLALGWLLPCCATIQIKKEFD
jgi:Cys-rich protein (TIGR01571 family)